MADFGAGEILLTSMDRDGTKAGFDLELTRAVSDAVSVPVIASGGVGTLDHLADGIQTGGADAVLAASIFHYGEFTVAQAKARMAERGIPVRGPGGVFQPLAASCGSRARSRAMCRRCTTFAWTATTMWSCSRSRSSGTSPASPAIPGATAVSFSAMTTAAGKPSSRS
jgi:hypothetical protein